jgi:hypothetical protein
MGVAKRQMRAAVKELLKSACRKTVRISIDKLNISGMSPEKPAAAPAPAPDDTAVKGAQ